MLMMLSASMVKWWSSLHYTVHGTVDGECCTCTEKAELSATALFADCVHPSNFPGLATDGEQMEILKGEIG